MAKITIIFALLLFVVSAVGCYGPENLHAAALFPAVFGVLLAIFGVLTLALKSKVKILTHISSAVGILGLLVSTLLALNGYGSARSEGVDVDKILLEYRLAMSGVLLIYLNFCIHAFMNARAARRGED